MAHVSAEGCVRPPIAGIEEVLQFENAALHHYLYDWAVQSWRPGRLIDLANEMAEADHPIVRYAAGWAMADVALQPKANTRKGLPSYDLRLDCLGRADALWGESIPALEAAHAATARPPFKVEYDAYANRARWARACLPAMRVEAAWRSGQWLPYRIAAASADTVRSNALDLGAELLGRNWSNEQYRRKLLGMVREITAVAVLQDDPLFRFIVRPASMRQDHHFDAMRRTDLIAMAVGARQHITPIQVSSVPSYRTSRTSQKPVETRPNIYVLRTREALVTAIEKNTPMVLKGLLAKEYDPHPDPALVSRLGALSYKLATDISQFRRAYDPAIRRSGPS